MKDVLAVVSKNISKSSKICQKPEWIDRTANIVNKWLGLFSCNVIQGILPFANIREY